MNPRAERRHSPTQLWSLFEKSRESSRRGGSGAILASAVETLRAGLACFALAVAPLAVLAGCTSEPQPDETVTASQFRDVVVPAGLRLVDDAHQSHSVEAANWRLGHFVYAGTMRRDDAISYVRQRMPQHNWVLAGEQVIDDNTTILRFTRGHYAAEYKFIRQEGRLQMVVDYRTDYTTR
jgi:hypothetical protein